MTRIAPLAFVLPTRHSSVLHFLELPTRSERSVESAQSVSSVVAVQLRSGVSKTRSESRLWSEIEQQPHMQSRGALR